MATLVRRPNRRVAAFIMLVAAGVLCSAAIGATMRPVAADASGIGGTITRSEVLTRVHDWYQRIPANSYCEGAQSDCAGDGRPYRTDPGGQTLYRPDCSGLVSMAWHLSPRDGGLNTATLPGVSTEISFNALQPGDLLDDTVYPDHHAILFEGWQADHIHFSYYSFGGGGDGSSPPVHVTGASRSGDPADAGDWAGHPVGHYKFYRYNHIVDDRAVTVPAIPGSPAVVFENSVNVFARGTDGTLAEYLSGGTWHTQNLGGQISGNPVSVVYGNAVNVFARGQDGALANYFFDGTWHTQSLGGQIAGDPAAVVFSNAVNVFARAPDNTLINYSFNGTWHAQKLGGQITGNPVAVVYGDSLHVFARGGDGALEHYFFDGTWHVQNLGGQVTGDPAAAIYGDSMHVFARGHDGALVDYSFDGTWQLRGLGGQVTGDPAAVVDGDGDAMSVFVRGGDGALVDYSFDGIWQVRGLGGQATGDPAAVVDGDAVSVFARGGDGALAGYSFDGTWRVRGLGGQIAG